MAELISTTCSMGRLVVTEANIILGAGSRRETIIPRMGLAVSIGASPFTIYGPTKSLTFQSMGNRPVKVSNVPSKVADQILAMLR